MPKQYFCPKFSRQVADEDGKPIFFEIDGNQPINTTDASITKLLYAVSGLHEPDYTFKKERTYLDETGSLHSQYKVYYRDIFVRGMDYAVHAKNNKVSYVNGWVKEIEQKETKPNISAKEAELLTKKL